MTGKRNLVHTAFLFLLPLIVAWFGFSLLTATGLVLLMLLWRWMILPHGPYWLFVQISPWPSPPLSRQWGLQRAPGHTSARGESRTARASA